MKLVPIPETTVAIRPNRIRVIFMELENIWRFGPNALKKYDKSLSEIGTPVVVLSKPIIKLHLIFYLLSYFSVFASSFPYFTDFPYRPSHAFPTL
jgi:hypothetical protein